MSPVTKKGGGRSTHIHIHNVSVLRQCRALQGGVTERHGVESERGGELERRGSERASRASEEAARAAAAAEAAVAAATAAAAAAAAARGSGQARPELKLGSPHCPAQAELS
uniref:Probable fibrosin-1 n=1 Tax=Phascolarctos cinereus TaxID=38626 RepID=A0A6P5KYJ2_PHACI|nr:probable fibrosin-1 [Phascolarctos cinereus]